MPEYKFNEVMTEGLRLKANVNRMSTQATDAYNAKQLLRFFDGYWITHDHMSSKRKLVTPEKVDNYIMFRESEGVGPAGIRRELALGSRCIRICCQKKHWTMPNPFQNPDIEQAEPRDRQGSVQEIAAMILAADHPFNDLILYWLATWARPSEGRLLKWAEIHGDRVIPEIQKVDRVVRGRRRATKRGRKPYALSPMALEIIERQARRGEYVFTTSEGEPLTKNQIGYLLKKARKKAAVAVPSVATLQPRDLRRTSGTWARNVPGVDLRSIADQMRHSSTKMAEQVYTEPSIDRAMQAVSAAQWRENVEDAMKELAERLEPVNEPSASSEKLKRKLVEPGGIEPPTSTMPL